MDFALSRLDVAIILVSGIVVLLVGLQASRRQDQTARGYFLASGRLPWWIIGSAFVSTSVSSEQIVGTVGAAYKHGLGIANWEWCSLPVYTLLILFFIPVYLKNRVTTVSEFLQWRYSPLCADIYSWIMLFALDVYRKLINPAADDRRTVRVGQLASLCALIVAALIAPGVHRFGGIFQYFQTGVTYLSTPFISVLFLGILWKRTSAAGGLFGVVGGSIIQIAIAVGFPLAGYPLHWLYLAAMAQAITMAGVVAVSLVTPAPPAAVWEPFLWRPSLLSHYDEGAVRPWYQRLKLWYGVFAVISLYLYWRFW